MDTAPFLDSDRTFVPLRYLAYALGMSDNDIHWDGTKNEATFTKNKTTVKVTVGSRTLTVNKELTTMDVTPQIRDSRVFLPARWVAEAFDANVSWDGQDKSVIIEYVK
ncbi:MAG: copper amine oxidase N-terminal domain-containing protein [Candidatus Syntrophopropionicum ammoniitolerans]